VKDPVHAVNLVVTNFPVGKRHTGRGAIDQGALRETACPVSNMRTSDRFLAAVQAEKWGEKIPAGGVYNEGLPSIVIKGKSESVHYRSTHYHGNRNSDPLGAQACLSGWLEGAGGGSYSGWDLTLERPNNATDHAAIIVLLHFYQPVQGSSEVEGREC
jgi:hypothetical protein